ncbi:MAG TPA: helix-turn-helix domain-containing protein [Terriglobales bacterium]|nr:helix-turn-helix domain-containing protein [Terriglobales bacterium]
MRNGIQIQAWRLSRGHSLDSLAAKAGLPNAYLESIESGRSDPAASTLEALAAALGVPTSWLYGDPEHLDLLFADPDGEVTPPASVNAIDPSLERILLAAHRNRTLYVLLTAILESGDSKLLRAAEVNLRSLVKQSKQAAVPWQSRPPGHFEPPSD